REFLLQAETIPRDCHALRRDRPQLPRRRLSGRDRHRPQL
ncbi:MAG: Mobile element protein, partial [uncultured Thermomicrobiales bacterium]